VPASLLKEIGSIVLEKTGMSSWLLSCDVSLTVHVSLNPRCDSIIFRGK
jgi:hypothetical protein